MSTERNVPKLRFPGFTEPWEQRKLGELGEIMTGFTPSTSKPEYYSEDGIPWVTPTDINALTISDTPRKLSEEGVKVGRVVPANTILCTCIASIGKNALLTVKGSFNQQINSLTPNTENDAYFLLTESELWSEKMKRMAASGTMQIVNKTEFSEITTKVPAIEEQQKIASYFDDLDHLITLHQRKLKHVKDLKKSMLQKMFPKNGQEYPELRFPGFTEPWEQRKLGELAEIVGGGTPSTSVNSYWDGDIDWYAPAEIGEQIYLESSQRKITEEGLNKSSAKILPIGTVLFTSRAGIGKTAILLKEGCTNQGFQSIVPNKVKLDSYFIFTRSEELKRYGETVGAGSTFVEVSGKQMANMELMMPKTMPEQQQIGEYFANLDHLITLHQRELEHLKLLKKGMLQQMFV